MGLASEVPDDTVLVDGRDFGMPVILSGRQDHRAQTMG